LLTARKGEENNQHYRCHGNPHAEFYNQDADMLTGNRILRQDTVIQKAATQQQCCKTGAGIYQYAKTGKNA
jgi:hypothetical protein